MSAPSDGDSPSARLLRFIQERSDDLEKVVLLPPGVAPAQDGVLVGLPVNQFILMLHFVDGNRKAIFGDDVELVLNDGILHRMKIHIELRHSGG
jgi:hypothetical protein